MPLSKNKKCPNAVIFLLSSIVLIEIIYRTYQYMSILKKYTAASILDTVTANLFYLKLQTTLFYGALSVITISFIVFAIFKFSRNFSYAFIIFAFNGLSNTANTFLYIKLDPLSINPFTAAYGLIALALSACFFIPSITNYLFKNEKN